MRKIRRPLCSACLIFLLSLYLFTDPPEPSWNVDKAKGLTVTVTGTVADRQIKNDAYQVFLNDVTFQTGSHGASTDGIFPERSTGIVVTFSDKDSAQQNVRIGARIETKGVFEPFELPACEGQFDPRTYYMIRGYEGRLKRSALLGMSRGYGLLPEKLRMLRDRAATVLDENMSEEDAGLVAAMTLGDKTDLDSEIKELYQLAGISHVLALSGLHIASVGLAILKFLKKVGIPVKTSALLSGILIGLYAVMTGLSISTVRAMIMFALSVAAILAGRTYDLLSAAAASAILILIDNRYYIYDTGFLLSFGAVIGIACIYPILASISGIINNKIISAIFQAICITVSVTIATLPVTAYGFMQIPVFSALVNLAVIPLMGFVLLTGFAGIFTGCIGLKPAVILRITHYILSLYSYLAKASSKIPGNIIITGRPSKTRIITYVSVITIAIIIGNPAIREIINNIFHVKTKTPVNRTGRHNIKNNNGYRKTERNKITYIIETSLQRRKKQSKTVIFLLTFFILTVTGTAVLTYRPEYDLEIRNIDVGQGDCALISGDDVPVIMIDGGSSDIRQVGKYRITPVLKANKIKTVDCWFLTHMDSDHVSGVLEILEDDLSVIRINEVVISDVSVSRDPDNENLKRLFAAAEKERTKVVTISAGSSFKLGDITISCLSPGREGPAGEFDPNDASLVLRLESKDPGSFSAVFTGDISENTERAIEASLTDSVYLKVAHHGSKTSSSDAFLRRVRPEISVISVGEGNSYGHPSTEALKRLKKTGSRIYRTDKGGEIILTLDDGIIRIREMKASGGSS